MSTAKKTQERFIIVEDYVIKGPTDDIQEYSLCDLKHETWNWRN